MVELMIADFLIFGAVVALGVYLRYTSPTKKDLSQLDEALATVLMGLAERLGSLDDLIEMLPSLVPNVNLTNQNPIISLIEAFQAVKYGSQGSNTPPLIRNAAGQFNYGATDESTEGSSSEAETVEAEIISD